MVTGPDPGLSLPPALALVVQVSHSGWQPGAVEVEPESEITTQMLGLEFNLKLAIWQCHGHPSLRAPA
jgi:hypothetical protein